MTKPNQMVDVRQPQWSKVMYGICFVIGIVALVIIVFISNTPPLSATLFLLVALGICVYNAASVTSLATATAHGPLRIRNRFRIIVLAQSDVETVAARTGFGSLNRVELLCRNGSMVPLVASEMLPLAGTRQRLEHQAAQLQAWLSQDASR